MQTVNLSSKTVSFTSPDVSIGRLRVILSDRREVLRGYENVYRNIAEFLQLAVERWEGGGK